MGYNVDDTTLAVRWKIATWHTHPFLAHTHKGPDAFSFSNVITHSAGGNQMFLVISKLVLVFKAEW